MSNTLQTNNGIIRFYDGTIIAIEAQEYSSDGISNWEEIFNPNSHISTLDGVSSLEGHRFKRVKHSGDTSFQSSYRIIPDEPVFRVQNDYIQYKLESESDSKWKNIVSLEDIKGEDGADGLQGIPGEGFHIDLYGYYQLRPDCTNTLGNSSCTSCNPGNSNTGEATTFMSLADGVLVLTQVLITAGTVTVDSVAYSHFSNDLITWTPLTEGIIDFEARYLATNGTGAVYTDMRTEDYYSSRGVVYVCADGSWTVLANVATPSYMVGQSVGSSNIGFLDNFIGVGLVNFLTNTIGLDSNGEFNIVEQSINENALAATIVGDGLEIPVAMNPIQVAPTDFTGFGLAVYSSIADSLINIQVNAAALLGDAMATQSEVTVDGETRNLFRVDVNDLINNNSGIIAVTQGDTYDDLVINLGDGLELDGGTPQAVKVKADELSLEVTSTDLHIKAYVGGNDGVRLIHLNPDIVWPNRGFGLDTANGLYTRIDNTTIGYDGSGNLEVPFNSITGDRLNDNVVDNTKGLEVSNDFLVVKVDGTSIDFNGSGELEYIGLSGLVVADIVPIYDGNVLATLNDNVTLTVNSGLGTTVNMTSVSDVLTVSTDIDTAWLDAYIIANHPAGATAWGSITGTITAQTDLINYIAGLNHVILDTWYDDSMIHSTYGLILKAPTGETYRLIVDAEGNTDTISVVV